MDFSNYIQKRLTAKGLTNLQFGSLTNSSVYERLSNISLFQSASLDQLNNLDLGKLLQGEINENATSEEKALGDIVNAFMELEGVQSAADIDGDKVVSEDEAREYLQSIMGNDGDESNFSISDIDKAIENLGIDLESIAEQAIEDAIKTDALEEEKKSEELEDIKKENEAQQASNAQSAGGSGVNGNSGVRNSGNAKSVPTTNPTNSKDGDSVEEIEKQIQQEEDNKESIKTQMEADIAEQEKIISEAMNDKESGFPEGFEEKYNTEKAKIDEQIQSNDTQIEKQRGIVQDKTATVSAAEKSIESLTAQKSTLEGQLGSVSSEDENADSKRQEIEGKIDNIEAEISAKEDEKEAAEQAKEAAEAEQERLSGEKETLVEKRDNLLDTMIKENNLEINSETQEKIKAAQEEIKSIRSAAQEDMQVSDKKIQDLKIKLEEVKEKEKTDKIISENSVSEFDFDFDENLSEYNKQELAQIKEIFEANRDKYEKVAEATGVPAELICAIHYREGSCNFGTYLHNGDPLGKPTTHVPKGKNFSTWEDAAIDAIMSQNPDIIKDGDFDSCMEYAERYNGLGYRNKGIASPYVWAGTTEYTGGLYVADGQFSASAVDKRCGVAVIMKALLLS